MITHIVLFKLVEQSKENLERTKGVLAGMEGKIPQLKYLEVGIDVIRSERSYDIALVTKFDSLGDLQAYQNHPVHLEVAKYIASVRESAVSVDFEA